MVVGDFAFVEYGASVSRLAGLGVVVLLRRFVRFGSKFKTAAVVESAVVVGALATVEEAILGRRVVVFRVVVDGAVVVDRNFSG